MHPLKRRAAIFLSIALLFAVLTPVRIILALPGDSIYHRSPSIFAMQAIPYIVCGALWLPSRNPSSPVIAYWLSLLLFAVACLLYVPLLAQPKSSGDMIWLAYLIVFYATMATIVVLSIIAAIVTRIRRPPADYFRSR